MKFIHLSDLHIGKRVNEFSMLDDQKYILLEIIEIIEKQKPDFVMISGDVYDKTQPSGEAVRLLDDFIFRLSSLKLPVFIISGNHDSAERIAFGARIMQSGNIFMSPVYDGNIEKHTLSDEWGNVNVFMLPFIKPVNVRQAFPDEEINSYVDTKEPMDKAGAYAIQGMAAKFIERIDGDYYSIMGLPLHDVYKILQKFNCL